MRHAHAVTLCIGVVVSVAACQSQESKAAQIKNVEATRTRALARRLAMANANASREMPLALWIMPPELREISGLALTADGRLLAHGDEAGIVYEIDARQGVVLKRFSLGEPTPAADFEGITVAGSDIYMLASDGNLYEFREGANGSHVPYSKHDMRLGKECEFEGVAFEPDSAWLVMPCKKVRKKNKSESMRDELVIYRWRLDGADSARVSMLVIPLDEVVHPSDITIDPATGNYVLVASQERALVVITPGGEVVRSESLPGRHAQAEGVAITKDSILIVSDEATTKKPAAITLYRWRQ